MSKRWPWSFAFLLIGTLSLRAAEKDDFKPKPHDWPQWQGPERTAQSRETGLLKSWPKEGPKLAWKATGLGGGFSTPSVAAGRVFGMGFVGEDEVVWALQESTGKEIWSARIAKATRGIDHGSGPRCTPTVDGEQLYALGIAGELACLEPATGKILWQKNLTDKEFGGRRPGWGYSESPLVDGDKLIVTPGGKTATLAALNKKTGETLWKAQVPQGDGAAYSSIIAADACNRRQYIQFLNGGVVGVSAADGKFLWRYNNPANGTANCSTPIYHDSCVFAASGYGKGGGLVQLSPSQDGVKAEEAYFTKDLVNQHGGMVLIDGYLYGSNEGLLTCLEYKTGKVMWAERKPGKGSIAFADGHLYYRNEGGKGTLVLVEVNPKQYVEKGRFDQPDRSRLSAWPHPVIANGKLYVRDQDVLLCYDVKQK